MKNIWFKTIVRSLFFRPGSVRTICFGPMRGMVFRVSHITGLSPWYSGVERKHQRTFDSLIQLGDVVVDIGANWGLHTLYLSRLVGQNGLVVSIEPFPTNFAELEWHIQINDCRNVKALSIAISNEDEEILFVPGGSPSTGSFASISSGSSIQGDPIMVTAHKLDSVVKELCLERLKLVKIDVEGAEGKVLLGAQETIESLRPYFVIDLHTPEQDVFVAQLLTSHKYKLQRLSEPPILRTDAGWPDQAGVWGSILAVPT